MFKNLISLILLLVLAAGPIGCKDSRQPAVQEEEVKTAQEMEEQARQEITEENMDDELSRLEEEIDADTGSEP